MLLVDSIDEIPIMANQNIHNYTYCAIMYLQSSTTVKHTYYAVYVSVLVNNNL